MKFIDFATGNFQTAYAVGSVVKGATVLTGYMTGVISPNNSTLLDEPIRIGTGKPKSSYFNTSGYNNMMLNDKDALARSSNSYMFKLAIAIGDGRYLRNERRLIIDKEKSFQKMRDHFGQFGLGVRTGIDLPGEQIGYKGNVETAQGGHALDFAIGQYDTYTPLQLAQYVSTIANGGYRMKPQIVKEIREPGDGQREIGPLAQEMKPIVLNKLDASENLVKRVQEGFWKVFQSSIGTGQYLKGKPYRPAGKTGTAETVDKGTKVWNSTLIAYAPYENPEIAMSIVIPSAYLVGAPSNNTNMRIAERVMEAYFELKAKRAIGGTEEDAE